MDRYLLMLSVVAATNLGGPEHQMESEFYLQVRREWDERYGDLVLGKRNRQITSGGLMLLSLILALGIVWMSARSKVIPYIVEVDKLGYAFAITIALTPSNTPATVERIGLAIPIEAIEFRMEHAGLSWKQVAARQRRILKSILYSLAVVAIGGPLIALARCAGVMRPTFPENNPGAAESLYEPLHPLLYSRDVFLPSWTSTREHYWWPDASACGNVSIFGRTVSLRGSFMRYYL